MSDLNEKALEFAEKSIAEGVQKRLVEMQKPQFCHPKFSDWDGENCFDCQEKMSEWRLGLGRVRCVDCQTIAEKKGVL
jgi:hypothetical protein